LERNRDSICMDFALALIVRMKTQTVARSERRLAPGYERKNPAA